MTGIVIITYNILADVFILQVEAIKKFCRDQHEIIVVDNSYKEELAGAICYHATRLSCRYKRIKASSRDGSDSHAWAANYIYGQIAGKYSKYAFFDHDLIPVKPFSVEEILKKKFIAGIAQAKTKKYLWPGCLMFDADAIPVDIDFSPNSEFGLDTGGNLYKVVEEIGDKNCEWFNEVPHQNPHFRGKYDFYNMINDDMFIHFVNGSNWNDEKRNAERLNSLINITKGLIG